MIYYKYIIPIGNSEVGVDENRGPETTLITRMLEKVSVEMKIDTFFLLIREQFGIVINYSFIESSRKLKFG